MAILLLTQESKDTLTEKLKLIIDKADKHIDRLMAIDPDICSCQLDEDPLVDAARHCYTIIDFINNHTEIID